MSGQNGAYVEDEWNDFFLESWLTKNKKREEALSEPDLYSNVRVLSRHALEVEQSLQKGTPKAGHLSHLVQQRQQGKLVILVYSN